MYYELWGYTAEESCLTADAATLAEVFHDAVRVLNPPLVRTGRGRGLLNAIAINEEYAQDFCAGAANQLGTRTLGTPLLSWKISAIKYSTGGRTSMRSRMAPTMTTTIQAPGVSVLKASSRRQRREVWRRLRRRNVKEWLAAAHYIPSDRYRSDCVLANLWLHPTTTGRNHYLDLQDAIIDALVLLAPSVSPGITELVKVHSGFLLAYNKVVDDVLSIVKAELTNHPTYRIVVTGHSLGGAIASLAAPSLKIALPEATLKLYTFDRTQASPVWATLNPRASWKTQLAWRISSARCTPPASRSPAASVGGPAPDRVCLALNGNDGAPRLEVPALRYGILAVQKLHAVHAGGAHGEALRQRRGLYVHATVSKGSNPAHTFYFGQFMAIDPLNLLCRPPCSVSVFLPKKNEGGSTP
ncbi:hypothetical protein B0H11DRAFT_2187492 [Mycena galericulata]|nr:hypothetical protein B0H11DRAFT_2187492 [Mycena galericulata]